MAQVTDFLFYVVAEAWPNRDVIYGYFSKVRPRVSPPEASPTHDHQLHLGLHRLLSRPRPPDPQEKHDVNDHNVACIMVFPPFQSGGWGRLLMEFSS